MSDALVWTLELAVGVPDIDAQHQELFRQVDILVAAIGTRQSREVIVPMLQFLARYVSDHFRLEEDWMVETGYPGYRSHKAEHDRLATDLAMLRQAFDLHGPSASLAFELRRRTIGWLAEHIPRADVAMARWIAGRPTGDTVASEK